MSKQTQVNPTPASLPLLLRNRLRAQADLFATFSSHGTIVGTAREIALAEFIRELLPKRFEVLTGAIAQVDADGKFTQAASQLDVIVADTHNHPTVLRTGDLAIVLPPAVAVVVESKSSLAKGKSFRDAMNQIGRARLVAQGFAFTVLFCFGPPKHTSTLRRWLVDLLDHRTKLIEEAKEARSKSDIDAERKAKRGSNASQSADTGESDTRNEDEQREQDEDEEYAEEDKRERSKEEYAELISSYSATALPDLIVAEDGAIALRNDTSDDSSTTARYEFYEPEDGAPSVVALAQAIVARAISAAHDDRRPTTPSAEITSDEPAAGSPSLSDHQSSETVPNASTVRHMYKMNLKRSKAETLALDDVIVTPEA